MIFPRSMAKVTPQERVGKNYRETHRTSTAITDARGSMYTHTQTRVSKGKDDCGSTCTYDRVSVFTDIKFT